MSTLICKKFNDDTAQDQDNIGFDDQIEIKFSPLGPLIVELMKRKSLYYMGLEQHLFFRLLRIIRRTTIDVADSLMEMKIMLTLRKHRLNEEFEALGDLFDIDKTTAQRYYAESKDLVSKLYHSLINSDVSISQNHQESNDIKNPLCRENMKINGDDEGEQVDEDSSESEPEYKYKGYAATDSDIDSDDFKDSDFKSETDTDNDLKSEDFENSDFETDEEESEKDRVECAICGRYVFNLDYHLNNTHFNPQHLNKTHCGLCSLIFQSHHQLRAHQIAAHNGNVCMCDVCSKMFKRLSDVKKHILKIHSKVRPFLCHLCGEGYYEENRLKIHMDKDHLQIRDQECSLCDKKYYKAKDLQVHIVAVHSNERPYKCRFAGCDKSFGRSGTRSSHEQMHKTKFSCEICSKVFSFRQNLQTHCKNIHGRNLIDTEKCKIVISQ